MLPTRITNYLIYLTPSDNLCRLSKYNLSLQPLLRSYSVSDLNSEGPYSLKYLLQYSMDELTKAIYRFTFLFDGNA